MTAHLTIAFKSHYVIAPSIHFWKGVPTYAIDNTGDKGEPVSQGFEYNSGTNPDFLTPAQIRQMNDVA